ncbi:UNVERIFIED_CONTAM: hypothetical protein FKN15_034451 [Acipenser sinensis]
MDYATLSALLEQLDSRREVEERRREERPVTGHLRHHRVAVRSWEKKGVYWSNLTRCSDYELGQINQARSPSLLSGKLQHCDPWALLRLSSAGIACSGRYASLKPIEDIISNLGRKAIVLIHTLQSIAQLCNEVVG